MKRFCCYLLLALLLASGYRAAYGSEAPAAVAEDSWKSEFERVCGQTDNAADMTAEELKKALAECDALLPKIEALEATPRKVYLKRLQMCRNLFAYLLEGKEKK